MEDTEIIDLFFARSEEAVSQCQRKYGAYLRTVSGNILGNREDTEEILNDSFLAAWNTIPPRKPPVLKFYLSGIVRNLSFKRAEYRGAEKRSCNAQVLLSELEECIPDGRKGPEEEMEAKELAKYINVFLETLPRENRVLFLERYYLGLTAPRLAKKHGGSARQIKYRLTKLREEFRNQLAREGVDV